MSKKIIAILTIATILFVCIFAACEKNESVYSESKDLDLVTDENGEKILAEDGQLLVYVTDEKGKYVKDESGEKATQLQQFQPIEDDGLVEDYGFIIRLPEGWKTTDKFGAFTNESKNLSCEISIVKYFYDDYYTFNHDTYKQLADNKLDVKWEEDIELGKDYKGACRFTMKTEDGLAIMYFFENAGNVYKILFSGSDSDGAISSSMAFCKAMSFKPYTYYSDITAVSKESVTELSTTEASTTEASTTE